MTELFDYQINLLKNVPTDWKRYIYPKLKNTGRLLGIKGLRGVGKTVMLLQYLLENNKANNMLYVTAEHPYFYTNSLFDLAQEFAKYGGRELIIDEVHKYPQWSRELKLIYDSQPQLKILFSSSSALDLYRGEADLSRRLHKIELYGLSFREFLAFQHNLNFKPYGLHELIENHQEISATITKEINILPLFQEYLKFGYFPFRNEFPEDEAFFSAIYRVINVVLENDLAWIEDYSARNVMKLKKLTGVMAELVPYEPNISHIAKKLEIGRTTLYTYLKNMHDADILRLMYKPGRGTSELQKPAKIYFENPAFLFALAKQPEKGTIRELFFANQLENAGHHVNISKDKADFLLNEKFTFEVGGKNKGIKQIKNIDNSFLAVDDIESGFAKVIPLWLFGFLY
ncbi:MAG: AAA family ATPase [Bacteroidales bacterium]